MTRYLLVVDFQPGVVETPMEEWKPEEVTAHLDYYRALHRELVDSGELVESEVLAPPNLAKIVTFDGATAPVVTEKISAVPGPDGVALQQPIQVREVMNHAPSNAAEMDAFLQT